MHSSLPSICANEEEKMHKYWKKTDNPIFFFSFWHFT